MLVGCLTSQQYARVSQGRICSGNFTCCHPETEAADPTFYLTQSQYTDTRPTSPSVVVSPRLPSIMPGSWQGSHWRQFYPQRVLATACFVTGLLVNLFCFHLIAVIVTSLSTVLCCGCRERLAHVSRGWHVVHQSCYQPDLDQLHPLHAQRDPLHLFPSHPSESCLISVSVSAQGGIVALGKAHTRSAPSLCSLPKVALETVSIFVWFEHRSLSTLEGRMLAVSLIILTE